MVAWHPKFTATVLIASSSGLFTLADTTSNGYAPTHQVCTLWQGGAYSACLWCTTSARATVSVLALEPAVRGVGYLTRSRKANESTAVTMSHRRC